MRSLILAGVASFAIGFAGTSRADCPPGTTDLGVGCLTKTGPGPGMLPGGWQISTISAESGPSFIRINTRTGATDWCYQITVQGVEGFGQWRCRKMP
jgi:hypothetical protein